ncbi:MAG TPA: NlpC/P60 family protein [Azospirillaceae bacterium]|nr:NlpC/P60 family protein [Azospirillaceae bacterium]HRQ82061.1 NlpC/P60 family protein [Azospirillaceae bacterium]
MTPNQPQLDRRRHPFRPDLAALSLQGRVAAERYVVGERHVVVAGRAPLRAEPDPARPLDSELLFGESFDVYDRRDGWAWGQCGTDGYVGWVPAAALAPAANAVPTHMLAARYSFLFPAPDIKAPVLDTLPMGAQLTVVADHGRFLELAEGRGFVFAGHAVPLAEWGAAPDPVVVAESLLGVPYLWGGRSPLGIDCSGLVQLCLAAAGVSAPRDSDMQREELGERVEGAPRRGDIACFPGHVALMRDDSHVVHATAHHLSVCIEPLDAVSRRADPTWAKGLLCFRRITP